MTVRAASVKTVLREDIRFLLESHISRQPANRFFGWFSQIEAPLVARASIAIWRLFADLDLSEARTLRFTSLHACFTRELKHGTRPVDRDPDILTSPCDAIVGACGRIDGNELIQATGFPYTLQELLIDPQLVQLYRDGQYVTLRLTPSMYHRFTPRKTASSTRSPTYPATGGTSIQSRSTALPNLSCMNERAVIRTMLRPSGIVVTLVPVAAILVASIRLHFLDVLLNMQYRGEAEIPCEASFGKGQDMGWFQHGSTIIVFAPKGVALSSSVQEGAVIRMGRPLMRMRS